MSDKLIPIDPGLGALTIPEQERIREAARHSRAESTWEQYRRRWAIFENWCEHRGIKALAASPAQVCAFLASIAANHSKSTLQIHRAAISAAFETAGKTPPTWDASVKLVMKGLGREKRNDVKRKKQPMVEDRLREAVAKLNGNSLQHIRDRTILLVGHAGAFRRSELCQLNVEDVSWTMQGALIHLRYSKTDQVGVGATKSIPFGGDDLDAGEALAAWLEKLKAKSIESPLFPRLFKGGGLGSRMSPQSIALIVKAVAPTGDFSGHSLRSGFITDAARAGARIDQIKNQTQHKSTEVLLGYIREADPFADNAATLIKKKKPT